jgi:hypothetical protein
VGKPAPKKKPLPKGVVAVDIVFRVYVDEKKWRDYWSTREDMRHEVTAAHIHRKMTEVMRDRLTQLGVLRQVDV